MENVPTHSPFLIGHEESFCTVANRLDMYIETIKKFDQRRIIRERTLIGEAKLLTKHSLTELGQTQRRFIDYLLSDLRSGALQRQSIEPIKMALRHLCHRKVSRSGFLTQSIILLSAVTGFIAIMPRLDRFDAAFYVLMSGFFLIATLFCVSHSDGLSEEVAHAKSFLDLLEASVSEYDAPGPGARMAAA